jgi:hypothetical protein
MGGEIFSTQLDSCFGYIQEVMRLSVNQTVVLLLIRLRETRFVLFCREKKQSATSPILIGYLRRRATNFGVFPNTVDE